MRVKDLGLVIPEGFGAYGFPGAFRGGGGGGWGL